MFRRLLLPTCLAATALGSLATAPTHATTGPSFSMDWTLPSVIHEYHPPYNFQTVTLTNDGDVPLTVTSTTFMGRAEHASYPYPGNCTPVQPGTSCTLIFQDTADGADHTATPELTIMLTVAMTAPDGTTVTRTVSGIRPVVDDMPIVKDWLRADNPLLQPGQPLGVCLERQTPRQTPEPATLVGASSPALGDLMDPANPKIVSRATTGTPCSYRWISNVVPATLPFTDTVSLTVMDNEGNRVTYDFPITWAAATLATPPTTSAPTTPVPTTPGPTQSPTSPVTPTTSMPTSAPTTTVPTTAPTTTVPSTAPSMAPTTVPTSSGTPTATQTSTSPIPTQSTSTQVPTGPAIPTGTPTGVPTPDPTAVRGGTLRLTGPASARSDEVVTLKVHLKGEGTGQLTVTDAGVDSRTQLLSTTCAIGTTLTASHPATCEVRLRVVGSKHEELPVRVWARLTDSAGRSTIARAERTITLR